MSSSRLTQFWVLAWLLVTPGLGAAQSATAVAQYQALPILQAFDGMLEAVKQSTVSAQTAGQVTAIYPEVDDYVPQGALILEIDDTEQRARLEQAKARLASARTTLTDTRTDYQRAQNLYKDRVIPKANLDKARAAFESAQAGLSAAKAGVTQAERQLSYTRVIAPYGGILMERHVEVGEAVQPGQPLLTGLALDLMRVTAEIPQRLIQQARQATYAIVSLPDGSERRSEKLTFYPFADPHSHTFRMRVELNGIDDHTLYPGMFVKVYVPTAERRALMVPRAALITRSELRAVYVIDAQGQARLRQVRPGTVYNGQVEILAGLAAGERVSLEPHETVTRIHQQRSE